MNRKMVFTRSLSRLVPSCHLVLGLGGSRLTSGIVWPRRVRSSPSDQSYDCPRAELVRRACKRRYSPPLPGCRVAEQRFPEISSTNGVDRRSHWQNESAGYGRKALHERRLRCQLESTSFHIPIFVSLFPTWQQHHRTQPAKSSA